MELHEKIEYIRQKKGVQKKFIASKCGKKPYWYTRLIQGKVKVTVDDLEHIADALDVDIKIFFSENLSETLKNDGKEAS